MFDIQKESVQNEARRIINRARADLGYDLEGGSVSDLLLDNMPGLRDSAHAHELMKLIGEEPSEEPPFTPEEWAGEEPL